MEKPFSCQSSKQQVLQFLCQGHIILMPKFTKMSDYYWLCLLLSGRSAKKVETDLKPLVDLVMDLVVFITDFLWRYSFLYGLCLRRCSIFVRATDVQRIVIPQTTEPDRQKLENLSINQNFYCNQLNIKWVQIVHELTRYGNQGRLWRDLDPAKYLQGHVSENSNYRWMMANQTHCLSSTKRVN